MKTGFLYFILGILFLTACSNNNTEINSPDSNLKLTVNCDDSISYSVFYKGKEIVRSSGIALELSDKVLGKSPQIKNIQRNSVNEEIHPLYGKFKTLNDHYNEIVIEMEDNYSIAFRAYNEGVAYRFITNMSSGITVKNEIAPFEVLGNPSVMFPETGTFTSWEVSYIDYQTASAISDDKRAITPVLFSNPDGIKIVIAEADLYNYPGMYLTKSQSGFNGSFAQYPDSVALGSWGNFVSVVQRRKDYIAQTSGKRTFPWRIIIATDDDGSLLTNELIYKLSSPQQLTNVSWIKPGKATWEWWHDAMLPDADIPSGMANRNTELYKHYVDFASDHNIEYLMIDAGWSHIFDLSQVNPKVNIREVIDYAKEKNVGVFLWCVATALTDNADQYMKMMHDWGAVGLKVDFFDRDDQLAIEWYERIAKKAAEHQLMINFHGCSKPTGLHRKYPNVVNYEAVRGAECSKWDLTANPKHHLTFPFNRMLAGSLDYTPGSMRNRTQQMFKPLDPGMPLTQGTRCHELAMYIIYDQYFAMLCDSPSEYRKYPDIMKFLSAVPVSFDDTKVLAAKAGEYALMAKQKGDDWYVGGMTDWTARNFQVDFSFLQPGTQYTAEIFRDGYDANTYADQYIFEKTDIDSNTKMDIDLAAGGGAVIQIKKK